MRPSDLKSLRGSLQGVLAELSSLREVIGHVFPRLSGRPLTQQAAEHDRLEAIGTAIDRFAEQKDRSDVSSEEGQERRHTENLAVQWIIAFATSLAFIAAAVYAWEAHKQLSVMDKTYTEMQKQTALLSTEVKGTEAAFLDVNAAVGMYVGDFDLPFNGFKLIVRNTGHAIASNVQVDFRVSRFSIEGHPLGRPLDLDYVIPALDYHSGSSEFYKRVIFEDPRKASEILAAAQKLQETVRIEGHYSYQNGFGDTIKGDIPCRSFLVGDWVPCEDFEFSLKDALVKLKHK